MQKKKGMFVLDNLVWIFDMPFDHDAIRVTDSMKMYKRININV